MPSVLDADIEFQKLVESLFLELALAVGNAFKRAVVGDDELLVFGESDIEFDLVRAERESRRKSGQSVLGHQLRETAMCTEFFHDFIFL